MGSLTSKTRDWDLEPAPRQDARMAEVKVLNLPQPGDVATKGAAASDASAISQLLQKSMLRLTGRFLDEADGTVNYTALKESQEYREYRQLASRLGKVDVSVLQPEERKAFFINVYNALTVDSIAQLEDPPASPLDVANFWTAYAYSIGPHSYTLDQIEHGILRGNRLHPSTGTLALAPGDPRLRHCPPTFDPRIHFALNCGAKSCPAVRVYTGGNLEASLEAATKTYLRQEVEARDGVLRLPQILQWYRDDFAPDQQGMLRWIQGYVGEAERTAIDALLAPPAGGLPPSSILYHYDWSLNTARVLDASSTWM